ncbi:MAG: hypothetical protein S4CHLAM20_15460 [Chlamydiia bacterium]|nr:hypothetical protein [Chlamydiia bacterium]
MKKAFLFFLIIYQANLYSNKFEVIQQRAFIFFKNARENTVSEKEMKTYIINFHKEITQLGYDLPSLKEMINYLSKISEFERVCIPLRKMFLHQNFKKNSKGNKNWILEEPFQIDISDRNSLGYSKKEFDTYIRQKVIESKGEDNFDWTDAAIGGCEILSGALCWLLPGGLAKGLSLFLLGDGFNKFFGNVIEKGKLNEYIQKFEEEMNE